MDKGQVETTVKVAARKKAIDFTNDLKSGRFNSNFQEAVMKLITILLDWGQEQYIQTVDDEKTIFFNLFNACEVETHLTLMRNGDKEIDIRWFLRSLFFSLSRTMKIEEEGFPAGLKYLLKEYIGIPKLLTETAEPRTYEVNVNFLKYHVWKGIEIEEENAIYDLLRLMSVMVPSDNGEVFGYGKMSADIKGNGIFHPLSVKVSFAGMQEDVDVVLLEKSLTTIIKQIKSGYDLIRDFEGDIGWVDIMGKYYEKCNDPVFLTKKIGLKISAIYHLHKQKNSN